MALFTAGLTMVDHAACYRQQWPNRSTPGGVRVGVDGLFTGLFWPISLPGMIVVYGEYDGLFCS